MNLHYVVRLKTRKQETTIIDDGIMIDSGRFLI
jgi:hypothetical protein